MRVSLPSLFRLASVAAFVALCAAPAAAQQRPASSAKARRAACDLEIRYIKALNDARLPEYAAMVLQDVKVKFPEAVALLKVAELEQHLRLAKFDDARAMIAAEANADAPSTWAMRATLSDYLFAYGKYPEALGIYEKLFDKFKSAPPEEIVDFYVNSAYKYAQMLLFLNREREAALAYKRLLRISDIPSQMKRQATYELAELLVKLADAAPAGKAPAKPAQAKSPKESKPAPAAEPTVPTDRASLLAEANTAIEGLLWEQDLWFGRSVALLAHIHILNGSTERAQKMIVDYREQLEGYDEQLAEQGRETGEDLMRLSPMAECLYLIGTMLQAEGEKLLADAAPDSDEEFKGVECYSRAIENLMNVYVRYPSFSFAPEAMSRQEKMSRELDARGYEVDSTITPEQRRTVAQKQFSLANSLYHQNRHEEAIAVFGNVLKGFPEVVPDSINGLFVLAKCYTEFGEGREDPVEREALALAADAVAGHLAERFARMGKEAMTQAGDTLRGLAQYFSEHNRPDAATRTLALFFRLYPDHPMAATSLMAESEKKFRADPPDYEGAAAGYATLVKYYPKKGLSYDAQRRLADCWNKLGRFEEEIAVRSNYLARVERRKDPGVALVSARYAYARACRAPAIAELRGAVAAYEDLRRSGGAVPEPSLLDAEDAEEEGDADPMKAALRRVRRANNAIGPIVAAYSKLIRQLSDENLRPQLETGANGKKLCDLYLQGAYFERAYCFSALTQPESALPKYRKQAISDYETLLEKFASSPNAPAVLLQLGTLYSTLRTDDEAEREANAKKATEYFDRLSKEHPESEQAKNALFLQGKTLLELGFRSEGVAKFREMIANPKAYSGYQLATAAESLADAREYDAAAAAFEAARKSAGDGDAALAAKIDYGLACILAARGEHAAAANAFAAFLEKYPRSFRVVDANERLCRASVQATLGEKDVRVRNAHFAKAIDAVKSLRAYKKSPREQLDLQLEIGDILEAQVKVESEAGDKASAERVLRNAAVHYQKILISADRSDATILPVLEKIFPRYAKALLRMKTYQDGSSVAADVKDACEEYIRLFPEGKHLFDVRNALSEAEISLSTP